MAYSDQIRPPRRSVRLDTLVRLRWLAVIGQSIAVLVVHYGLEYELPIWPCLGAIALAAVLNAGLRIRFRMTDRLTPNQAAWLLAFDIAQLTALLCLTGGLQNPFAVMLLAPVLLSATALPPRLTLMLATFAVLCATVLVFAHYPLPWSQEDPLELPPIYMMGVWLSILLAIGFISIYAWQITEEARQLVDALAATERVLTREQHLSQLDGLAAAAAHELGTPLSTILVTAKELERAIDQTSPHADDVRLLREQAQRCRDILAKLTELSANEAEPFGRVPLSALIEEVALPHRNFGVLIEVIMPHDPDGQPVAARNPAILYGLGNLLENAVDFARERVELAALWTTQEVVVTISDDGPGFAPEVMDRIGEPYVRSSRRRRMYGGETTGLGLGFFIAKTLLERSGATVTFANRPYPGRGAIVRVCWPRSEFEEGSASLGLEPETLQPQL
jgi:two-component system sensor histidine kinase RegB